MPVIAIGFAAFAIATAVATLETVAIIAAVGATIAAVGAVTNNKALMIAGGVIGAIGGIGALAQSAGLIGGSALSLGSSAASGVVGETGAAAAGIDAEIAQWSSYGALGESLSGAPALSAAPSIATQADVIDQVSGAMQPLESSVSPAVGTAYAPDIAPAAAIDNAAIPQGLINGGEASATGYTSAALDPLAQTAEVTVPNVSAPQVPGTSQTATTNSILNGGQGGSPPVGPVDYGAGGASAGAGVTGRVAVETGAGQAGSSSGGIFGKLMDMVSKPGVGTLLSGVVQAGSSFISGATNGLTPAQIAALNAQAAANQAAANQSNLQQSNMREPLPVASRSPPVTGATGLINSPPRIPVTGAAA